MSEVFRGDNATSKVRLMYLGVKMQQVRYHSGTYRL